jgi:hypothetical protein
VQDLTRRWRFRRVFQVNTLFTVIPHVTGLLRGRWFSSKLTSYRLAHNHFEHGGSAKRLGGLGGERTYATDRAYSSR